MLGTGDILAEKYRVVRMIGRGGMGAVYEVHHEIIGKRLALKMLWPDLTENDEAVKRFTQEAQAAGAIGHPAIIDIHDMGRAEDGSMFLVMEFLEGQALGRLLRETPILETSYAAYVMCQVLSALDAAHGKGILHRDLKPDNIFLVDSGQALPAVKLLDFGVSKITDSHAPRLVETRSGTTLGTPFYMSPEQAQGDKDIDGRTDIWSTGVILYELLTGHRPFVAESLPALMTEVLVGTPTRPTELSPELPEELEVVILTALLKRKADRYSTAGQMLEALLPFVEEHARGYLALGKREGTAKARPGHRRMDEPKEEDGDAREEGDTVFRDEGDEDSSEEENADSSREEDVDSHEEIALGVKTRKETPEGRSEPAASTDMAWQSGFLESAIGKPRRGLLIGAVLGCLLLLGGVVALITGTGSEVEEEPTSTTQPSGTTDAIPVKTANGRSDAGASHSGDLPVISIALEGVPEKARVLLDGEQVEGHQLERPQSKELHKVQVEAEGFVPWSQRVSFEQDRTIAVKLSPTARLVEEEGSSKTTKTAGSQRVETSGRPRSEPRETSGDVSQPAEPSDPPPEKQIETPATTKRNTPRELEPDPTNPYGAH